MAKFQFRSTLTFIIWKKHWNMDPEKWFQWWNKENRKESLYKLLNESLSWKMGRLYAVVDTEAMQKLQLYDLTVISIFLK